MTPTDTALYERWKGARDADAFAEIVSRHSAMVFGTCRRIVGNQADAEDVAQECFIDLARTGRTIRRSLPGWLYTTAVHRSLDRLRGERRRRRREAWFVSENGTHTDPTWDDLRAYIDEAIAELPEKLRAPVIYRFMEGRTHDAIAADLSIARSTVQYRLGKGIDAIRKSLKKRGIPVATSALAAMLSANLAAAAPATLTATLGTIALAGTGQSVSSGTAAGITALGGMLAMKKAMLVATVIVAAAIGLWAATPKPQSEPMEPTREAPVPEPQVSAREAVQDEFAASETAMQETVQFDIPAIPETGMITGRVYDEETEEGINGVQVKALPTQQGRRSAETETDSDGVYRIESLAQGEYTVEVDDIDGYYDPSDETQTIVLVRGGTESKEVNFALREGTFVQGKVVDAQHVLIADAEVSIRTRDNSFRNSVQSESDGTFLLAGVPHTDELFIQPSKTGYALAPQGPFEVPDEGLQDLLLVMGPESSIEGTVVDTDGNGLEGFRVSPSPRPLRVSVHSGFKSEPSDSQGRFRIAGLFPATYSFSVGLPGEITRVPLDDVAPVEVGLGERVTDLVLVCDFGNRIEGTVTDVHGEPIDGVLVEARGLLSPLRMMRTDSEGTYVFDALKSGLYNLWVTHPDYGSAYRSEIPAGSEHIDFVLESRGALVGQVIDTRTEEPVTAYEINTKQVHDTEGRFLLDDVEPGQRRVHVRAPGYAPHTSEPVLVRPGETTYGLIVKLEQGAIIEGIVLSPEGKPVKDARLFLDRPPISRIVVQDFAEAVTGNDGTFRIESVPSDAETIYAYHPQYAPASEAIRQGGGIVNHVELTLGTGGVVQGFVRVQGEPLPDTEVTIGDAHPAVYQDRTSEDGSYRIEGLPSGPVQVVVMTSFENIQNPHGRRQTKMAYIEQGFLTEVDFDFDLWDTEVEGVITINGEPPGSTKVMVMLEYAIQGEDSDGFSLVADESGYFACQGPRPGPATLLVWPLGLIRPVLTTADDPEIQMDTVFPSKPVEIVERDITTLDFDVEVSE